MKDYKYISEWLGARGISLADGFAETLRRHAVDFKRKNNVSLCDVYSMLGCSKQNVSYWGLHGDSTQSRRSVLNVVHRAAELFELCSDEAEALANRAGLSLRFEGGDLIEHLSYCGKRNELSGAAMISERMLRHYKKKIPPSRH